MALSDLQSAVNAYEEALAADAVNPQPTYSLDGQSVSRNEWRAGISALIIELNKTINALNPYVISTRQVVGW